MTMLPRPRVCPDCPATHAGVLEQLVDTPLGCAFRCLAVTARAPVPSRWRSEFGVALIRRGIVMRQRVDSQGRASAIDIAGPGSAFLLGAPDDDGATAFAVDDTMLCLLPARALDAAIEGGGRDAQDVVRAHQAMSGRVERLAEARSRTTSTARIATMLVAIADTLSAARSLGYLPAAIQQRDIAALTALRHESVCRVLNALTRTGAIEKSPQGLRIVDRAALLAVA